MTMKTIRNYVFGALAAVAVAFGGWHLPPVIAQNAGQFVSSVLTNDAIQIYRGGTAANVFTTVQTLQNFELLKNTVLTAQSINTTAEQTLGTYSLPANSLTSGSSKLLIRASYSGSAAADARQIKLYFGASVIATASAQINNVNGFLELVVTKNAAAADKQIVWGQGQVGLTNVTPYVNYGTDDDGAAIVIKATAITGALTGGIILNDFSVQRIGG